MNIHEIDINGQHEKVEKFGQIENVDENVVKMVRVGDNWKVLVDKVLVDKL